MQRAGIQLLHVPYPGSPQAVTDVVAGRITMLFTPASSNPAKSWRLRQRPTNAQVRCPRCQAGMPDFDTSLWLGLAGPGGLSRPVIDKLADPAQKAMQAPESAAAWSSKMIRTSSGPINSLPSSRAEKARWSAVASAAGLLSKS